MTTRAQNDEPAETLRYPPAALVGDYLRSAFGVGVGGAVLAVNPASWALALSVGSLTALFAAFGARTAGRHATRVALTADGVSQRALVARRLAWTELSHVRLRYYGSKRERARAGGFYQLKLRGRAARLSFESGLDGFDVLVWRAAVAAKANRLALDDATAANMQAFGIDADGDLPPPPEIAARHRRLVPGDPGHDGPDAAQDR